MANQEHLDILKQGVEVWNRWRKEQPKIQLNYDKPDGYKIDLSGAVLSHATLTDANLRFTSLNETDLSYADLQGADFGSSSLKGSNLHRADLKRADLIGAELTRADLSYADLDGANLLGADLSDANLSRSRLFNTLLRSADLINTNFTGAFMSHTVLTDVDLSEVKGLEKVKHGAPLEIGIDTIYLSQGNIPEVFLKGAGVPDSFLDYMRSLVGKPIDYYSCFISYSSKDKDFAERLYADLQVKGVRCWLDKEDLKIGEKFRPRIDEAIRRHDKLLLVLSEHSVKSVWVEKEVETAFEKERRYKKLVLFPIRLDESIIRTRQAWAADIRRMRHIGDFTGWKNHDDYQKAFNRLLRDLKAEAQKMGSHDATTNDR